MKDIYRKSVVQLLDSFISGESRSLDTVRKIEGIIATQFPDDSIFDDFLTDLSLYSPAGGEFLLGDNEMVEKCRQIIPLIKNKK